MPRKPRGKVVELSAATPNWPPLVPLMPKEDLSMNKLLENQIIVIRNLFTSTLCKNYVSFLSSLPLITTPAKPKPGEALRVNDRFEVHDAAFAEQLWNSTALKNIVAGVLMDDDEGYDASENLEELWGGNVCGLNPRIRIYRYGKGQFFGQHYDESVNIMLPTTPPTAATTTWTLLIYLTGPATGCVGGETVFYPEQASAKIGGGKSSRSVEPIAVELEVGMALLHKHGQDCLLHEGRKVLDGEKWVIRSDLCVRK